MERLTRPLVWLGLIFIALSPLRTNAQEKKKEENHGEFYFSWGYNTEWYTKSTVKIVQSDLNNDYKFKSISGHDHKGWDDAPLTKDLTIPQYNWRIGYLLNDEYDLGFEISFDHTKFIFGDQQANIVGTLNGKGVDSSVAFNEANGFYYYLNNGANFLLFNVVKRWKYHSSKSSNFKLDFLVKGGVGPVIPHVENSLFGQKNDPNFQFGGWNTGIEGDARATFLRHIYLEFAGKLDYARYTRLKVYKGYASHNFGTAELILSIGYTFGKGTQLKK